MTQTQKELKRFFFSGIAAVGTDCSTYYLLNNLFTYSTSKIISFILGTIVAYMLNKYWTFERYEKSFAEIIKFTLLYSATLAANVLTNKLVLNISGNMVFLAFLSATSVSTVLNFIGQKWWVFRH